MDGVSSDDAQPRGEPGMTSIRRIAALAVAILLSPALASAADPAT